VDGSLRATAQARSSSQGWSPAACVPSPPERAAAEPASGGAAPLAGAGRTVKATGWLVGVTTASSRTGR
jgi:hypothetical protein